MEKKYLFSIIPEEDTKAETPRLFSVIPEEDTKAVAFGQWIETSGLWYYVDANGSLFVNGTTPDGYRVDANGVWIR